MTWRKFWLLACGVSWLVTMGGLASAADAAGKIKVLVVTGGHGFEKEAFFKVFEENPEITFTAATQGKTATVYERPDLLSYDVVLLYDMINTITDAQKAKFLALFDQGVGLVVTHHALVSFQDWPDYERIVGGKYLKKEERDGAKVRPASDYKHDEEMPVIVVAKRHPITLGINDFTIHDEIYINFHVQPDVFPLLTTTHPRSGKPLAWTRTQGKSRVVYLELGHDHQAYENPNYRRLVAQSIRWTARR